MDTKTQLTWWQIVNIIIIIKMSLLLSYAPIVAPVMDNKVPRESWLVSPIAGTAALLMGLLVYFLSKSFPGLTVFEYSKILLGKYVGTLINILIILSLINIAAHNLRYFTEFLHATVLIRTPTIVIMGLILALSIRSVFAGIEVIGRVAEFTSPIIIFTIIAMIALLSFEMDFDALKPMFFEGYKPLFYQSLTPAAIFGNVSWIALLTFPYLSKVEEGVKSLVVGMLVNIMIVGLGAFTFITVLGVDLLAILTLPAHTSARMVGVGILISRLEWLVYIFWLGTFLTLLSLIFFGITDGFGKTFNIKNPRPLVIPAAIASSWWSFYYFNDMVDVLNSFQPVNFLSHNLPLQLGVPLVLTAALQIKKFLKK